jgi:RHH-type transcriptional regulator, rel operon repressor / antitoxin RelB
MPTSIRLDAETERRLDALAKETGRTKAFYLREIIRSGIEDIEDYYSAKAVSDRIRRGEEETVPHHVVRKELGLED